MTETTKPPQPFLPDVMPWRLYVPWVLIGAIPFAMYTIDPVGLYEWPSWSTWTVLLLWYVLGQLLYHYLRRFDHER